MVYVARFLATCPHPELRNSRQAIKLAQQALSSRPHDAHFWETMGMAHYGAGQWKDAIDALQKTSKLTTGYDSFFLAMAHWQLGEKAEARRCYHKAVVWMGKRGPGDEALLRFRAEAEKLMGIENRSAVKGRPSAGMPGRKPVAAPKPKKN